MEDKQVGQGGGVARKVADPLTNYFGLPWKGNDESAFLTLLAEESRAFAFANGVVMGLPRSADKSAQDSHVTHAPVTLLPAPMPAAVFRQAYAVANDFNVLVHRASRDHEFVCKTLALAAEADSFTGQLLKLYKQVYNEGWRQKYELGLHRSDYMLHVEEGKTPLLQQVEINTISAAFSALSTTVSEMHRFVISKLQGEGTPIGVIEPHALPQNRAGYKFVDALASAHKAYDNKKAVIMMIVQGGERNAFDQRWIEYKLYERHNVHVIRRSLTDIAERAKLDESSHILTMDGHVVAVAYFRAGYTPDDYHSDKEWHARLTLERSDSIKCPSLAYHLIGAKKVQQVFSVPGVLERFFDATEESDRIARIRACFTGQYSLDHEEHSPEQDAVIKKAIADPDSFIMKPQREGGGNNFNGDALREALTNFKPEERAAYVLMDRIRASTFETLSYRAGQATVTTSVYELGVYSSFLAEGEKVILDEVAGHLLRTKESTQKEGGVVAGASNLDSPLLI
eukprot:TRINITY_DN5555_c0_g1_i1.p1 TRINITY_DN5555_c0_g1~~TRINITY_DN5555_c0_g1_i1.p1  ORF type:complete len:512 (+),score=78.68 TRINITY_DN5555_c0_g1_i1:36-1571(+)